MMYKMQINKDFAIYEDMPVYFGYDLKLIFSTSDIFFSMIFKSCPDYYDKTNKISTKRIANLIPITPEEIDNLKISLL